MAKPTAAPRVEYSPAGVPYNVWPDGTRVPLPPPSGGQGPTGQPPASPPPAPPAPAPTPPPAPPEGDPQDPPPIPRAQHDAAMQRNAAKAGEKALADWAEAQGMTLEEAEAALKAHQASVDASKTETDRDREAAAKARAEAESAAADAAKAKRDAKVALRLAAQGLEQDTIDFVLPNVVVVDDPTDEEVDAAIEAVKQKVPQLFDSPGGSPTPGGTPPGTGGGGRRKPPAPGAGNSWDAGKKAAEERFGTGQPAPPQPGQEIPTL